MVFFNHATRQMTTKIVYYGPGLCGKTTNLNTIYGRTSQKARGEMVSLNTETDRTLFFDLLPMDVGMVGGFKTKLQLYTVPGQVFYNSTRKLVLKGVDGIVFVADSQVAMLDANRESFQNLRDNLRELGLDLKDIPLIFQWNKRDLKNIVPVEVLERELNADGKGSFQSIAQDGTGVFETLRGITKLALASIKALHMAEATGAKTQPAPKALKASEFSMPEMLPEPVPEEAPAPAAKPEVKPQPLPEPEALHTRDLPSFKDLFDELEVLGNAVRPAEPVVPARPAPLAAPVSLPVPAPIPAPVPAPVPAQVAAPIPAAPASLPAAKPSGVQVMSPLRVKLAPAVGKGAPAFPRVNLKAPVAPAHAAAAPHVARVAPMAMPKAAAARPQADLQVDLSPFAQDGELEIVVTVRQNGAEVGSGTLLHAAPAWGASGILAVELKRS